MRAIAVAMVINSLRVMALPFRPRRSISTEWILCTQSRRDLPAQKSRAQNEEHPDIRVRRSGRAGVGEETKLERLARLSGKATSKGLDALARHGFDLREKLSAPISRVPRGAPPSEKPKRKS
jgi:hypothetical protein